MMDGPARTHHYASVSSRIFTFLRHTRHSRTMSQTQSKETKWIALIGSSGGGTATLGHTNTREFIDVISRHFSDGIEGADVKLVKFLFVSMDDGSGFDGATGSENVTLHDERDSFKGTLAAINEKVKVYEKYLADEIRYGNIDGLISVSCKPSLF